MRSRFRRISAPEGGFTLVEVITASALMLVVVAAMIGLFSGMQRFGARQSSRSEATDFVRLAMDRMTKEIRQATQVRTTSTASLLDIDTYINGVETRVVYTATADNVLKRTVGTTTLPMVERLISTAVFTYSSDPATGAEPSIVTINIRVRPEKFTGDDSEVAVVSEVQLRNR